MIQLEELKSKLLELKPQIDDYRSAIGMDDLVKKQHQSKGRHLYKDGKRLRRLGHAD